MAVELFQEVLFSGNFVPEIFRGSEELAPATGATGHHGNLRSFS
jgi:hypothetical protein